MVQQAVAAHNLPRKGSKQLKILYATQAEVNPPTFVFFVNDAKLIHFSYQRYLENKLRQAFGFNGTPLRLVFKTRGKAMIIAKFVAVVIIGYLLGSIPVGFLITRRQAKVDVREYGSGKIGATNVLRTAGRKSAALVVGLGFVKGSAGGGICRVDSG